MTLDLSEYHMFCGGMDGSIFQVDLCAWVSVGLQVCSVTPSHCHLPSATGVTCQSTGGPGSPVSPLPSPDMVMNLLDSAFLNVNPSPSLPSFILQPVQRDRTFQTERENGKIFKGHR